MSGGVALTMRPPWPSAFSGREFRALRSGWVWLALVATLAVNVSTLDGSGRLLEGGAGWGGASTSLSRKPLIEKLDKKPLPNKDMTGFVRATLADIAEAVNDHPRLATPFAPGALPQVDAAVAALARLPRPPAGDRARAKELNNQANQLMARKSDWSEIADLMVQAHAADPQDAEILNFLAYSQMQSGRHAEALKNILESLRLAPTSANGWNRLAQIRLAAAKGDARQIQEASRYYVVTYWFSRDRPRVMRYFNGELTVGPGDSPDNPAAVSIALQRLPK
jgi:tetratricopeptide (TPR) repeat protein